MVFQDNLAAAQNIDDVRSELRALVSSCGVYHLASRTKLSLAGKDRVRWLNGMVTNNIRDLAPGHGVYAFLLNPQGHILGDLYAYNRGESLAVDSDDAQKEKLFATLRRYIIMDKVELADVSGERSALGLSGPEGADVHTAGFAVPDLAPLQFVDLSWRGVPVTAVRSDNSGIASFELWLAPEHAAALQQEVVKAGAQCRRRCGPGTPAHCIRRSSLRAGYPRARSAPGNRTAPRLEFH